MNKNQMTVAIVAIVAVAIVAAITIPTLLFIHAGTERHRDCVESGGSYVMVDNTENVFECEQPGFSR